MVTIEHAEREVRLLMVLQIIAGAAWWIWLTSGTAGLESGLTVGALLVIGLGAENLLDTFWKEEQAVEKKARRAEFKFEQPSPFSAREKMTLPSPNWSLPAADISGSSSILPRRFERGESYLSASAQSQNTGISSARLFPNLRKLLAKV